MVMVVMVTDMFILYPARSGYEGVLRWGHQQWQF